MKRLVVTLRKQYAVLLILVLVIALSLSSLVFATGGQGQGEAGGESMEASSSFDGIQNEEDGMTDPEPTGEGDQESTEGAPGGSEGESDDPGEGEEGDEVPEMNPEPEEGSVLMGPMGGGYAPLSNGNGGSDPSLLTSDSDEVTIDYEINQGLSWYYNEYYSTDEYQAYLAGNSFSKEPNVSNIGFSVKQPGVFSFDYRVSTYSTGGTYALYYNINQSINSSNYPSAINYPQVANFRGDRDWTRIEFNITQEHLSAGGGEATIYFAYYRGGSSVGYDNYVALANVRFLSGTKTVTLNINGIDHGHVETEDGTQYTSAVNTINFGSGETVNLTAVPGAGKRFYGWVDGNNRFLSTDDLHSFMISADTTLIAVFAPEGHYTARRNGVFHTTAEGGLWKALDEANSDDLVVMLEDHTMTEDVTIPAGVKLYIPYNEEFDEDGSADGVTTSGSPYQASTKIATSTKTYRTLTINSGATLTIDGTVCIGSVIGYPSQYYQGHTSGWHGKIVNEGQIVVNEGGVLDCWGLIAGAGTVESKSGGSVYEPFIVYDFAGGWNTAELYFAEQSPFKQYAMQNIQNKLTMNAGATLYGRCNLWASSKYNKVDIVYLGTGGMYELADDATLCRTYDVLKHISTNTDIGKTTYTFNGGMTLNYLTMPILGVGISTKDVDFPLPYNMDIILESGENNFSGRSKIMPGATLRVEEDASLTVEETLFVLDGLIQSDLSGKFYPTTQTLKNAGFSASGQLVVNGSLEVLEGARFGGVVQTELESEAASISIAEGALVNCTDVQDGAVGEYDVNTSLFDLPARAYVYDSNKDKYTFKRLHPGREYLSHGDTDWTMDDYTMTFAVNCSWEDWEGEIEVVDGKFHNWKTETVTLNEPRKGSWEGQGGIVHDIAINHETVYGEADGSRTYVIGLETDDEIYDGGDIQFTVDKTEVGQNYVFQVSYQLGDNEPTLLNPDTEGIYKIEDVSDDVSIIVLSCKRGDVLQDNAVDNFDLTVLREVILDNVSVSGLRFLAADLLTDGEIDNLDLVIMRYLILN